MKVFGKSDWLKIYFTPSWAFGWMAWDTHTTDPQRCVDIWVIPFIGIRLGIKRCNCDWCKEWRKKK